MPSSISPTGSDPSSDHWSVPERVSRLPDRYEFSSEDQVRHLHLPCQFRQVCQGRGRPGEGIDGSLGPCDPYVATRDRRRESARLDTRGLLGIAEVDLVRPAEPPDPVVGKAELLGDVEIKPGELGAVDVDDNRNLPVDKAVRHDRVGDLCLTRVVLERAPRGL